MDNSSYFIDVLQLMPEMVTLVISTTDNLIPKKLGDVKFQVVNDDYIVILNTENRHDFQEAIKKSNLLDHVYLLQIRLSDKLLYEGYDQVYYGKISKDIILSPEFINKYVDDETCMISSTW